MRSHKLATSFCAACLLAVAAAIKTDSKQDMWWQTATPAAETETKNSLPDDVDNWWQVDDSSAQIDTILQEDNLFSQQDFDFDFDQHMEDQFLVETEPASNNKDWFSSMNEQKVEAEDDAIFLATE